MVHKIYIRRSYRLELMRQIYNAESPPFGGYSPTDAIFMATHQQQLSSITQCSSTSVIPFDGHGKQPELFQCLTTSCSIMNNSSRLTLTNLLPSRFEQLKKKKQLKQLKRFLFVL